MLKKSLFASTTLVLAASLCAFPGTTQAAIDVNLLLGSATFDDFLSGDNGLAIGFMSTISSTKLPVAFAFDFIQGDPGFGDWRREWDLGLRKIFRGRRVDLYVGGGAAFLSANEEIGWSHSCEEWCYPYLTCVNLCETETRDIEFDTAFGGWVGTGVYIKAWRFNFGIDVRYSRATDDFRGYVGQPGDFRMDAQEDIQLGGWTFAGFIGFNIGPRSARSPES